MRQEIVERTGVLRPVVAENLPPRTHDGVVRIGPDEAVLYVEVPPLVAHIHEERLTVDELRHGVAHVVGGIHPIASVLPQEFEAAEVGDVARFNLSPPPPVEETGRQFHPLPDAFRVQHDQFLSAVPADAFPARLHNQGSLVLSLQPHRKDVLAGQALGNTLLRDDDGHLPQILLAQLCYYPVPPGPAFPPAPPERDEDAVAANLLQLVADVVHHSIPLNLSGILTTIVSSNMAGLLRAYGGRHHVWQMRASRVQRSKLRAFFSVA